MSKQAVAVATSIVQETEMTFDEIEQALNEATAAQDRMEAEAAVTKARNVELEAEVARLSAELETVRKSRPTDGGEDEDEAVIKSLPAHAQEIVRKARAEASEANAKLDAVEKARIADAEKVEKARKAADLTEVGIADAEKVADALVDVAKAKPEAAKVVEDALRAAAKAGSVGALFRSYGSADTAFDGDPEQVLKSKAAELRAKDASLSEEAAYAAAMEQNPQAYNAYIAKRRSAPVQ